ncbi:hypothetical protein Ahy_B04g072682 isoform C [Arachis hypogaea]|uniref:MalT-like TPR region domain-containing protein n=1 Tax=Arachis hypogaea TaxID=3818 RepID=A0A444ZNQ4_ARAHY|nr:hypothetical protein Ahy_B04g072682 isoform C [Arachis hypogaea]
MFRIASSRLSSRAASSVSSTASFLASLTAKPSPVSLTPLAATSFRSYGNGLELDKSMANPDAINMINYALNHARTDKSFGSYGLGLLVLKHCLTIELTEGKDPKNENSKGIALLAMSTLEYERGEYDIALEKLQSIHELTNAYLGVRVAALEAEAGLYLELGQDDKASAIADKCVEVVEKQKTDDDDEDFKALILRAKALKGLIELVKGSIESGTAALSYGEFLYLKQNYSMAKEVYTSVLKGASDIKKFGNPYLGACNMNLEGLMMGALCSLGQLETYQGNYGNAEKALTQALTLAEETYGEKHPKVGVVLTSIALMYRRRAMEERTSSLMVQEGLYRKVIDILKVTETESEGSAPVVERSDIAAIARGGYAEVLSVQENRKSEGEKLKKLAETIWKNRRLTLDEALLDLESSKISIIDPRISRIL